MGMGTLIPVPPARATKLDRRPCLDHSTTPFASNGPIQNTQTNSQREPKDGRKNTYTDKPASAPFQACGEGVETKLTEQTELGLFNMRAMLQAHHFWMIRR